MLKKLLTLFLRIKKDHISLKFFWLLLCISLIVTITSNLYPMLISKIVGFITTASVANQDTKMTLCKYAFYFLILILNWMLGGYYLYILTIKCNQKCLSNLQNKLITGYYKIPVLTRNKNGSGYYQQRILNDAEQVTGSFYDIWVKFIVSTISVIMILIIMFKTNIFMTILTTFLFPLSSWVAKFFSPKIQVAMKNQQEQYAVVSEFTQETIKTAETNITLHRMPFVLSKFMDLREILINKYIRTYNLNYFSAWLSASSGQFLSSLLLFSIGGWMVITKKLSLEQFMMFYMYPGFLWQAINGLITNYFSAVQQQAVWERMDEILDNNKLELYHNLEDKSLTDLSITKLTFKYNDDEHYLFENFNYTFNPNKLYIIQGSSGRGKTTLLNLIARRIKTNQGIIAINNAPLINYPDQNSSIKIGFLYQQTEIFKDTLKMNIICNHAYDAIKFNKVINSVQLTELIEHLENGIDTPLDESGKNISVGQAQRIGLARLIYGDYKIWLLDEPTSALDLQTETEISEIICQSKADRIIIMVTHRQQILPLADEIIDLNP